MPHIPHWIEAQLSEHFEGLNLAVGVDFDGSGAIEGSEVTDTNNDGAVDADEWRTFLNSNESTLRNLGGFFNYYFDYGTSFKPDNILHDLLFIESVFANETQIAGAYGMVWDILEEVRTVPNNNAGPLAVAYFAMIHRGIDLVAQNNSAFTQNDPLFIQNLTDHSLDCDTSSDILLAIAHEMDLPAYMVAAPEHNFVRYIDPNIRLNLEM